MNSSFTDTLSGWHDFYVLAGGAAATLTGLLFVAVSIHIDLIAHEKAKSLRQIAGQILSSFVYIIIIALTLVSPSVSNVIVMLIFLIVGIAGFVRLASRTKYIMSIERNWFKDELRNPVNGFAHILLPAACYMSIAVGGIIVFLSPDWLPSVLLVMMIVILYLMVRAIIDAWNLLIQLAIFRRSRSGIWDTKDIQDASADQSALH